jgi:hypothetical protein
MSDEIILYTAPNGQKKVAVHYEGETVWLTQKQMAELFEVDVRTISDHLQAIFQSGELEPESVIRKIRITAADGKTCQTKRTVSKPTTPKIPMSGQTISLTETTITFAGVRLFGRVPSCLATIST